MRKKRIGVVCALLALACAGVWRYVTLNAHYRTIAHESREIYGQGEIVPFGANYLNAGVCFDGYSIRVDRFEIVESGAYLAEALGDFDEKAALPERLGLVYITLFNADSAAQGVMLTELGFHSVDNYAALDWQMLTDLNPVLQGNYGISLSPDTSCSLVLPFALYAQYFAGDTWRHLESCTFYLHITGYPVERDIRL